MDVAGFAGFARDGILSMVVVALRITKETIHVLDIIIIVNNK